MATNGSTESLNTLFPGLTFTLLNQPPPNRTRCRRKGCYCDPGRACDVCGMTVKGPVYHCQEYNLDVHQACATLHQTIRVHVDDDVDDVTFKLRKGELKSKCIWCNQRKAKGSEDKVEGFRYESGCGDYTFHVFCLIDMERKHRSSTLTVDRREVSPAASGSTRLQIRRGRGGRTTKFVKVVKMFLTVVLSVLFGDPTAIIASVVVQLLT